MPTPAENIPARELPRRLAGYTGLTLFVAISFLFSPQPRAQSDYCGQYIRLGTHVGFTFNCDAADYCVSAASPSRLLAPNSVRQSRPLYVLAAAALGAPLQWAVRKLDLPVFHRFGEEATRYLGYYAAYVALNFLILLGSLYLLDEIARIVVYSQIGRGAGTAFQLALISNGVTKAFFWTAHEQFFTIFTPLLTIRLALEIRRNSRNATQLGGLSLLCGVLMLVYGNFLPMFVCLVLASFLTDRKLHPAYFARNWILFLAPTAVWALICTMKNGHYYNHETEQYRQLLWIVDALSISAGRFADALLHNVIAFARTFREVGFFLVAVVVVCSRGQGTSAAAAEARAHQWMLAVIFFVFFTFYLLLGFYAERLTLTLYPIVLCVLLICLSGRQSLSRAQPALVVLALCWHVYNVASYGPFS
jgi:hypothetical protein